MEVIDNALGERLLRAHHRQADVFLVGKPNKLLEVVNVDVHIDTVQRGAGVAGSTKNALDARRLGQLPHQGMFPAALANHQNPHSYPLRGKIPNDQ